MKRLVFKIVFLLIVLTPLWSFLIWWFWPTSILNGLVIDKNDRSASNQSQGTHWILNNENTKKNAKEAYDPAGEVLNEIQSIANYSQEGLDSLADDLEMIYYVEVSGSAPMELGLDSIGSLDSVSKKSALSNREIDLMLKMKEKGKLVLAEYNALLNPSTLEAKGKLEEIFQLNFTGWVGKYFNDLSATNTNIPEWIKERYAVFTGEEYAYPEIEGIILCHQDGKVLVLEMEESLLNSLPMINSDLENMEKYELPNFVAYPFWFDINEANNEEDVISTFKLQTNKKGDSILHRYGIPSKFPAIIGPQAGKFNYYFCGDFADNPVLEKLSFFKGIGLISRLLYAVADESDRKAFFWNFYRPLMLNILEDYKSPTSIDGNLDSLYIDDALDSSSLDVETSPALISDSAEVLQEDNRETEHVEDSRPIAKAPSNTVGWRIVIASLKSQKGTERYLNQLNNPEISSVWVAYLETNRITFGPFSDLGEAQIKYQQVLQSYPEAWMIKF